MAELDCNFTDEEQGLINIEFGAWRSHILSNYSVIELDISQAKMLISNLRKLVNA